MLDGDGLRTSKVAFGDRRPPLEDAWLKARYVTVTVLRKIFWTVHMAARAYTLQSGAGKPLLGCHVSDRRQHSTSLLCTDSAIVTEHWKCLPMTSARRYPPSVPSDAHH